MFVSKFSWEINVEDHTHTNTLVHLHTCTFAHTAPLASQAERMMMTVAEIVKQLVLAHEEGRDVNLNK